MKFTKHVAQIFWDVDVKKLEPKRHNRFIITRVAEKGAWADIRWLKKQFGARAIKEAVRASRNTSVKTKNFWKIL